MLFRLFILLVALAICKAHTLTTADLQAMALAKFGANATSSKRRVVLPASRGSSMPSMADANPWSHNAWRAQGTMQATLLLPNLPEPAAVPNVLAVDPGAKHWYSNAGPLGVQWINATSAFTIQETPYGPMCWQIPGWNFDQQVQGYRSMFLYATDGPSVGFSGGKIKNHALLARDL
jgi:hypothetical protein